MDNLNELILEEIRGLRTEVVNGLSETRQRLTAVETHTAPFFATDGGLDKMRDEIEDLKKAKWYSVGFIGAVSLAGHWLAHKLGA